MRRTRVSVVFKGHGLTLLVVESLQLGHECFAQGCMVTGSLDPIAIVVCDERGVYAMNMEATSIELDRILRETPELQAYIA